MRAGAKDARSARLGHSNERKGGATNLPDVLRQLEDDLHLLGALRGRRGCRLGVDDKSDCVAVGRAALVLVDFDGGLLFANEEAEEEGVLDALGERVRVDDELEEGDAAVAGDLLQAFCDL